MNVTDETNRILDAERAAVAEAKRRLEELDSGRAQPVPYDVVKQKLRAMAQAQPAEQFEHEETEAPSAKRIPPETEDAYCARVIAKIERGLADVKAGRVVPHAEVLAIIDARYSGIQVGDRPER